LSRKALKALDQGNASLSRTRLTEATQKEPDSKTAWNHPAAPTSHSGLLDHTEHALKTQITVNPNDEYAYNNLGHAHPH